MTQGPTHDQIKLAKGRCQTQDGVWGVQENYITDFTCKILHILPPKNCALRGMEASCKVQEAHNNRETLKSPKGSPALRSNVFTIVRLQIPLIDATSEIHFK